MTGPIVEHLSAGRNTKRRNNKPNKKRAARKKKAQDSELPAQSPSTTDEPSSNRRPSRSARRRAKKRAARGHAALPNLPVLKTKHSVLLFTPTAENPTFNGVDPQLWNDFASAIPAELAHAAIQLYEYLRDRPRDDEREVDERKQEE
ncbi:hypothetical protein NX059_008156 [Plenodomus lindquistii]|nr:hypothetical protein NX059_008156 [Plenodomus lindquistii]